MNNPGKKDVEALLTKYRLSKPSPRIELSPDILECHDRIGVFFNPEEGQEMMTSFDDVMHGFQKQGRDVHEALSCLLQPTASADWGYRLARQYAERYNSRYGTGLIPESAPMVEDMADFWCQYHMGKPLRAWMAASQAS